MRFIYIILFVFILSSNTTAQKKQILDTTLVRNVDVMPAFPGGFSAWQSFISHNIDLSEAAMAMDSTEYAQYGSRQNAILEFTVCQDGEVCDVIVVNSGKISPLFEEEALRVMKKSPKWQPGIKNNTAVRTRFRQTLTAVL